MIIKSNLQPNLTFPTIAYLSLKSTINLPKHTLSETHLPYHTTPNPKLTIYPLVPYTADATMATLQMSCVSGAAPETRFIALLVEFNALLYAFRKRSVSSERQGPYTSRLL